MGSESGAAPLHLPCRAPSVVAHAVSLLLSLPHSSRTRVPASDDMEGLPEMPAVPAAGAQVSDELIRAQGRPSTSNLYVPRAPVTAAACPVRAMVPTPPCPAAPHVRDF